MALERVAVTSEKDEHGRLLWMRVASEGNLEDLEDSRETELAARIAHVVRAHEKKMRHKAIATAIGEPNPAEPLGTFKRGLAKAVDSDWIVDMDNGYYSAGLELPPQKF